MLRPHSNDPIATVMLLLVSARTLVLHMMLACTLAGFIGQLTLQSRSLPGEMPRATFERVTGLYIATARQDDMTCEDMLGMGMAMPRPNNDGHSGKKPGSGSCPLCPLLHLPAVVLAFAILRVLCGLLRYARKVFSRSPLVRLDPGWRALRPPPIGPPSTI